MATLSAWATQASGVSGTWSETANATGADDGSFATWANSTRRGTATFQGYAFGTFASIPSGATINKVTVRVKGYVSNTAVITDVTAQLMLDTTGYGTATDLGDSSTTTNVYPTFDVTGVSLADVQSGNLRVYVNYTRANVTTTATAYVDSIQLTVDYTAPITHSVADNLGLTDEIATLNQFDPTRNISVWPSSAADGGSSWVNPTSYALALDGNSVTWASSTASADSSVFTITLDQTALSHIPDGSTINSVTARIKVSMGSGAGGDTSMIDSCTATWTGPSSFSDTRELAPLSKASDNPPSVSYTLTPTLAQLKGGAWTFQISASRSNTTTATYVYLDAAWLEINYTPPESGGAAIWIGNYGVAASSSTASKTSASFNAKRGDVLVCFVSAENSNTLFKPGAVSNSGTALNWTLFAEYSTGADQNVPYVKGWWAVADSDRTAMTVTVAGPGTASWWGLDVHVWAYSEGVGNSNTANNGTGSGLPSVSLTTTQDNSGISALAVDWAAVSGSGVWATINGTAGTVTRDNYDGVYGATHAARYVDAGAAGSKTVAMTSPSGQRYAITAIEILGTSGSTTGLTQSEDEVLGLTDSLAIDLSLARTDSLALTDSRNVFLPDQRHDSNLGITDSLVLDVALGITDTEGITDEVVPAETEALAREDSLGLTDIVALAVSLARTDGLGLTDSRNVVPDQSRTDPLGLTDSCALAVTKGQTDNLGLTDDCVPVLVVGAVDYTEAPQDSLGITDAPSLAVGAGLADVQGVTDTLALFVSLGRTDGLGMADSAVPAVTWNWTLTDSESLTDERAHGIGYGRTVEETINLSDEHTRVAQMSASPTDIIGTTDSIAVSLSLGVADNVALSDSRTVAAVYLREHTDSLGLTDERTITEAQGESVTREDSLGLTDSLSISIGKMLTDNLTLADTRTVVEAEAESVDVADSVTVLDELDIQLLGSNPTPLDPMQLADTVKVRLVRSIWRVEYNFHKGPKVGV